MPTPLPVPLVVFRQLLCTLPLVLASGCLSQPDSASDAGTDSRVVVAMEEPEDPNLPGYPGGDGGIFDAGVSIDPNTLPGVMCARVYDSNGWYQNSFCAPGQMGLTCRGDSSILCVNDNTGIFATTGPRSIWYQKAIDWAKQNGYPKVVLDPGVITVTDETKIPAPNYPINGIYSQGVGLHVPSGIHLEGSQQYDTAPTVINVPSAVGLEALVLVDDDPNLPAAQQLANVSVSYLTLSGTTRIGYSRAQDCPSRGHTLNSILDLDGHEPTAATLPEDFLTAERLVTVGVRVQQSNNTTGAPVNLHHLKIAHVGGAISFGFNTVYIKEDPQCQTVPGLKITLTPKPPEGCPTGPGLFEKNMLFSKEAKYCRPGICNANGTSAPADVDGGCPEPSVFKGGDAGTDDKLDSGLPRPEDAYCMSVAPTTEWGAPSYCAVHPYEFLGNPNARSQVHHNSICDVKVAINVVGGHTDVFKNVAVRKPTSTENFFGMSTDGHLPYSQSTTYTENFVSGFKLGFLTDGSQYAHADDCTFQRLVGYHPAELQSFQHVLDLRQHMFDAAQSYFAQTDPLRGFIDHLYVRDNRFYKNQLGMTLYRVNWGFVGFNIFDSQGAPAPGDIGVVTSNSINSWIYGNQFRKFRHAIDISGSPGHQSTLGACYNGIHTYCSDYGCPVWGSYPNTFSGSGTETDGGTVCNVAYHAGYCADPTSIPSPAFPNDAGVQCYAY
ncbi:MULTISPECIES: hypothetical protein [unclassified Corallococcus]|uniref:hypothetical protein n=1 Tax=unclassified Corallococcus TaxID=2685029 RepID=UPI001A8C977D|nr:MULTISPECIES: hypothetical protein [unclassified Corallococcus]MBN9685107.1 hypothetical protein [Corallococcus sp. NCSPR001]WAS83434.1 hypothetical protein O0N60_29480 [Corallococcus sp. NCRR]